LRITWKNGVSIEYGQTKVTIDPRSNNLGYPYAFVSHAHFDHSAAFRAGSASVLSSKETGDIASTYGCKLENWRPLTRNKGLSLGEIEIIPHNSGHVLGSFEFEVGTPKGTALFTGDFNIKFTKTMKPAEPVPCDILIVEATFGSPSFSFPCEEDVANDMINWAKQTIKREKIPTFQADPLGNAQEIVRIFNESTGIPVVTHGKISRINRIYESYGHELNYTDAGTEEAQEITSSGELIFIAPKGLDFSNRPKFSPALVSGWALWSRGRGFPLSDHADFNCIMEFTRYCKPRVVLTYHGGGYNHVLAKHIEREFGARAYPIELIPTNFFAELSEERLKSCEKAILGIAKVPGFSYSRKAIMKELKGYGFSTSEINSALKRLLDRGSLVAEKSKDYELLNKQCHERDHV